MTPKTDQELAEFARAKCAEIGARMATQDNLVTRDPMFIVQQKTRIYGLEPGYHETEVWIGPDGEEGEDGVGRLVGVIDIWEFVTACFTRIGAENYLAENGHNLCEPRIYVETGFRNREWQSARDHFAALAEKSLEVANAERS